jgi:hypothetical protein
MVSEAIKDCAWQPGRISATCPAGIAMKKDAEI